VPTLLAPTVTSAPLDDRDGLGNPPNDRSEQISAPEIAEDLRAQGERHEWNSQGRGNFDGVLDMRELGQQQVQAESQYNEEKKVAPQFRFGRKRENRLGTCGHALRTRGGRALLRDSSLQCDAQGHIAGVLSLKRSESDLERRGPNRTNQPLFGNRQAVLIDLLPGLALQSALIDSGDVVFDPDAQILRFKCYIIHTLLSHARRKGPGRSGADQNFLMVLAAILSALLYRALAGTFLAIAFAGRRSLNALFFTRLQVVRVPFDVLDNLFLQNLAFETTKRTFHAFAVVNRDFGQKRLSLFTVVSVEA
jgi:hypothetical protein